ncbi:MAG: tRNA uridine-5-carboxymethylaminomethyl(34) synthesis GTPase MnmE [Clostridiales bacterium]|nr:tRNA uridine-5-carboxymethylaminomethyl(34) synthesis GTPase MnmE [Clostridiales bacterium]
MATAGVPIAAISTALQNAAIGVVRLSGEGAFEVAARVFRPLGGRPLPPPRQAALGHLFDQQGDIDLVVLTCWAAPRSYTGEDMAEFSCHGGQVVLRTALRALLRAGARPAGPGEFTKRAFLNGRLDLAESEAVIDLIMAESEAAARAALSQSAGALSARVRDIRQILVDCDADIMAYVDFSNEGIAEADPAQLLHRMGEAAAQMDRLLATCARGQILREGLRVAIIGRPNVGKSSLLNALAGIERSIVTELAGTTRDVVEHPLTIGGLLIRLQDTAGLRAPGDRIESLGVAQSLRAAGEADLLLCVFDGAQPLTPEDREVMALCAGREAVALINKCDLPAAFDAAALEGVDTRLSVSAVTGEGLPALEAELARRYRPQPQETLLTSLRHAEAIRAARAALGAAIEAIAAGVEPDMAEIDLREAILQLGGITGQDVTEDVLDSIFSRFCVGK